MHLLAPPRLLDLRRGRKVQRLQLGVAERDLVDQHRELNQAGVMLGLVRGDVNPPDGVGAEHSPTAI